VKLLSIKGEDEIGLPGVLLPQLKSASRKPESLAKAVLLDADFPWKIGEFFGHSLHFPKRGFWVKH
jgi:hypothetical protein